MSFTIFQNEKTPLQAIKTKSSESRKIDIFPNGLTHSFGPKLAIFKTFFLRQYRPGKCLLRYSSNEKTAFQAIKTRSSKSEKTDIFPKGLTYGFGPQMVVIPTFIFYVIQARKMSFTIFQTEKTPFQAIKTRSSKSRNIDIFPKGLTHGFGPKMALFPTFFFQAIQASKMSFTIFQNEKTLSKAIKTRSSKSRKTDIFPKGLTHGHFWSKNGRFSNFYFLCNIGQEYVFYDIVHKKKRPLQPIKTKTSKSRKNDIFPKGLTHGFGPRLAIFPTFFF